jgi:hypothetical protein
MMLGLVALIVIIIMASNTSGKGSSTASTSASPSSSSGPAAASTVAPAPAPAAPVVPAGQQNALRAAKQYLDTQPFSRTGLIKQLTFSGYSDADATYGVDT